MKFTSIVLIFFAMCVHLWSEPTLLSVKKIWDQAPHNAFTDLIDYKGKWYCVFREGEAHAGKSFGKIRLLASSDGETWESVHLFQQEGVDLRDPKLSITPKDQLMLLLGGTMFDQNKITRNSQAAFSSDGKNWTPFTTVLPENEWLWRVTWHEGKAYGVSYRVEKESWPASLFVSSNGVDYEKIKEFNIQGKPSETTLRFTKAGEMIALMRRGSAALIGRSFPPYTEWSWNDTKIMFGGPDFLILPSGAMWAAGRIIEHDKQEKTALAKMDLHSLTAVLELPSGGDDTGYPGMVYKDGILWISYYSSHESKSGIYLVKIRL